MFADLEKFPLALSAGLPEWGRGQRPSVLVEGGAVSGGKASEIVDGDAMGVRVACFCNLVWSCRPACVQSHINEFHFTMEFYSVPSLCDSVDQMTPRM